MFNTIPTALGNKPQPGMMMALSFELWYLRLADIKACELLERGISTEALLDAGFQESGVKG